ncbi:MAG: hypothetical protein QM496_07335 [Verrucomicrobiota bacterium]
MKKEFINKGLVVAVCLGGFLPLAGVVLAEPVTAGREDEAKGEGSGRVEMPGRKKDHAGRPPLADLSVEDREAMRKALQAVWENPEVMQARDEVQRATDAFRQAINNAVKKEDPRVASLVARMHGRSKSKGKGDIGPGRPPGAKADGRGGRPGKLKGEREEMGSTFAPPKSHHRGVGGGGSGLAPAGFRALPGDFSEEERKRLQAAREKAMQSDKFQKVNEKLKVLLKQGEELRKKRVQMFHRIREEMSKAMIEADPEVKGLLERIEQGKGNRESPPAGVR